MTTTFAPSYEPVAAPPLAPPTISLLSSANIVDPPSDRWFGGLTFLGEGLGEAALVKLDASDPKTSVTGCPGDANTWTPYGLIASARGSGFGFQVTEAVPRATRALMAHESRLIEQSLWGDPLGLGNIRITDAVDFTAAVTVAKAIATMEQGAADAGHSGSMLMFHMRPYLWDLIIEANPNGIRREGNRWYTAMNNVLVPGRGYAGTGPTAPDDPDDVGAAVGGTEWMYATETVDVRRGPISSLQGWDRTENEQVIYAERAALASFDASGLRLALEVTT